MASSSVHDPRILDTLSAIDPVALDISTDGASKALGFDGHALTSLDYAPCQDIGRAAEFLGFDSLRVRSARCGSDNIVIIVGHLTTAIKSISYEIVDWSKYR